MAGLPKLGILGSVALDSIFNVPTVPVAGERVFGTLLGQYDGGMAANQAVEAARYSTEVYLLGAVGNDAIGKRLETDLRARGVHTDRHVSRADAFSGQTFMHLVNEKSDYFSIVTPGANMLLDPEALKQAVAELRGGALLISLEINADAVAAAISAAKSAGVYVYLVCSPAEKVKPAYLSSADALVCNFREANMLLGLRRGSVRDMARQLKDYAGPQSRLLITLGSDGALLFEAGNVYYAPAMHVTCLDSVGAGDAFIGAFAALRIQGISPYHALSCGCIAGAMAVSVIGPQSSAHTAAQVEAQYQALYKDKKGVIL